MTALLLIVAGKMLHSARHARSSHTALTCRRNRPRHIRVLGKIFKIPAVKRMPVNIDTGSQQRIHFVETKFFSFQIKQLFHQLYIKAAGKQRTAWQQRCLLSRIHADTGRSVRRAACRNSPCGKLVAHTAECIAHTLAPHKHRQLLHGKLCGKRL